MQWIDLIHKGYWNACIYPEIKAHCSPEVSVDHITDDSFSLKSILIQKTGT